MPRRSPPLPYSVRSFYAAGEEPDGKALIEVAGRGPSSFAAYAAGGGFRALQRLRADGNAAEVLRQIYASGLRGCGGSHLPLARKWQAAMPYAPRYLVINGLEGEPDTFKDYFLLRDYPHIVLEGIAISCRVLGVREAYLVINAAYHECHMALEAVLQQHGAWFDDLAIHLLSGPEQDLYVVGEETALLNYIEGRRGEPRLKPPFPHQSGLWGQPTVVNNVETLSWIPILLTDAARFAGRHPKLVTLLGDVAAPGIYEVTLGQPLCEILQQAQPEDISFVEIGGISGGLVPAARLDVAYADDALAPLGVQVGAGTLRVFGHGCDPVAEMARALEFFQAESCGRCTPCRVGTRELARFARALQDGAVSAEDIHWAHRVAATMQHSSTCGLGRAAPLPLLSYLKHFAEPQDD